MTILAKELIISGKVQGVWYRASAQDKAISLGLKGWVKNHGHSEVHVWVQGNKDAIQSFVTWCHDGPRSAEVQSVSEKTVSPQTELKEFSIHEST